jgi:uncharacterized membrane protein YhaH (DUF805 family)
VSISPDGQWRWDGAQWVPNTPPPPPAGTYPAVGSFPALPPTGYGYAAPAVPTRYLDGAPVDFGTAVKEAFRHTFVYEGRASRSAYWWFALLSGVILLVTYVAFFAILIAAVSTSSTSTSTETSSGSPWLLLLLIPFGIAGIVFFLVGLSLTIRRLHDTDKSGWWYLISLVPGGSIVLLIFMVLEPTPGPNRYQVT